jgi:hypothetical protein
MVERALGKMTDGMTEAADTLRSLLHAEAESVRLGAARSILELSNKLREAVEVETRLAELERRLLVGHLPRLSPFSSWGISQPEPCSGEPSHVPPEEESASALDR